MHGLPAVVSRTAMSNSFIGNLIQICVVTRDHRKTIEGFLHMGIGPWSIRTADQTNLSRTTYRGKSASFSLKLCMANTANMNWEIIEPITGPSIYSDFLDRHGEGVQHVAVDCNGARYEERLTAFADHGYENIQNGVFLGAVRFDYFATEHDTKTIFEVFDVPPGFVFPEPDRWYPAAPPA